MHEPNPLTHANWNAPVFSTPDDDACRSILATTPHTEWRYWNLNKGLISTHNGGEMRKLTTRQAAGQARSLSKLTDMDVVDRDPMKVDAVI